MFDFSIPGVTVLFQVIMIDLVLAGDNAIVIGLAAAGLPPEQRPRVILIGVAAATVLRIVFAGLATQLLQIVGLLLAGGILLLWVCWKMWRELNKSDPHRVPVRHLVPRLHPAGMAAMAPEPRKTLAQATTQIVIADVSMSLDNVLAVAGAAREYPYLLAFGLLLSVAMMGVAATFISGLLQRHRWITYVGLAIILYVAVDMIYRGSEELLPLAQGRV
jgi:YjbE family integral membrane protein